VTEEQAEEIEEEWIQAELSAPSEYDRDRFETEREAIREKHGREVPRELHRALHDIRWGSYNRKGLASVRKGNIVTFRNTRLGMAQLLQEEGKHKRVALQFYLEVCCIDLNGL